MLPCIKLSGARRKVASSQMIFVIMAMAPTATDMPQNDLHENNNLEGAKAKRGGHLTTGEYQICCAVMAASFKQSIGSQTIDARVNLSYLVIRRISPAYR
jgi:hypothetical protein